ncbi:hypothetical protein [Methylobacterium sp. Leaf102]|uniref:hypothetical protein n=1 Tax=Methylobacterium sp. Leaf102 TaxID=1736253 RepID=UPI001AEBCFEE|nr:hypothetical protein [Methylobacterium sp. Leaf102]
MKPLTEALDGECFPIVFDKERDVFHIEYPTKNDTRITNIVAEKNSGTDGRWTISNSEPVKYAEMARTRFQSGHPNRRLVRSAFADQLEFADVGPGKADWFI